MGDGGPAMRERKNKTEAEAASGNIYIAEQRKERVVLAITCLGHIKRKARGFLR